MVDYLDADTANADWLKPATDDLRFEDEFLERQATIDALETLIALPAYEAIPERQKAIIERRLDAVAD